MTQKIAVVENILSANNQVSFQNRRLLDKAGVFAINVMASPGAGKTSVILQTFERIKDHLRLGVIEGDIASSIDSDRAEAAGIPAVQINTGGSCHLDAAMLQSALPKIALSEIDLLIVENVGNLVCPSEFGLGTHMNALVASLPEGDDKPYKYPGIYSGVDVLIINKIDLLPYLDFDMDYFKEGVEILNPGLISFTVSCKTGEGIDAWAEWLLERTERKNRRVFTGQTR